MKLRDRARFVAFMAAIGIVLAGTYSIRAQGQPPADQVTVYVPALQELPEFPGGKTALVQGTVDESGLRFIVPGLDILQPVSVMLVAPSPDEDLTLRLAKSSDFRQPLRQASTVGQAVARFQVRTQGDMRILVSSNSGPKPYQMVIWTGDEIDVPFPPLFTPVAAAQSSGAVATTQVSARSPVMWVIAALLFAAVVLLAWIAFRKRPGRASAGVLLLFALASVAYALPPDPPLLNLSSRNELMKPMAPYTPYKPTIPQNEQIKLPVAPHDPSSSWYKNPYSPNGYNKPPGSNVPQGWSPNDALAKTQPGGSGGAADTLKAPFGEQVTEKDPFGPRRGGGGNGGSGSSSGGSGGSGASSGGGSGSGGGLVTAKGLGKALANSTNWWALPAAYEAYQAWKDAYDGLGPNDEGYWPEYDPPGMPKVPSKCAYDEGTATGTAQAINDATGPCGQCFGKAHEGLTDVLKRFEKLRRVHKQTEDVYTTSIKFGDATSGIHGAAALVWFSEIRPGIVKTMNNYYQAYDAKYMELRATLEKALHGIGACEAQFFNESDWYNRYGFLVFTFVSDRHDR